MRALGEGLPIIAAPFPNQMLARHFAFLRNLAALREAGVRVLWTPDMYPDLIPRTGAPSAELFNWDEVLAEAEQVFQALRLPHATERLDKAANSARRS